MSSVHVCMFIKIVLYIDTACIPGPMHPCMDTIGSYMLLFVSHARIYTYIIIIRFAYFHFKGNTDNMDCYIFVKLDICLC